MRDRIASFIGEVGWKWGRWRRAIAVARRLSCGVPGAARVHAGTSVPDRS
ncbi:hypothetical protein [Lysobacter gummosus]